MFLGFHWLRELYHDAYDSGYEWFRGMSRNPKWLLMRQLARFGVVRSLFRHFQTCEVPQFSGESVFSHAASDIVQSVVKDGLYLGLNLPSEMLQDIIAYAKQYPCYGDRKPEYGFHSAQRLEAERWYDRQFVTASYVNTIETCPAIAQLSRDPLILSIAARYLGTSPVLISSNLWWSFVTDASLQARRKAAQLFHYDLDDYRFIKFFFYLTDVDGLTGAHACMQGTHRRKKLGHELNRKRFKDSEIIDAYGIENLVTIRGNAGFGFVEDTLCFHKGMPPIRHDRLMLQLEFATRDYHMQHDRVDPRSLFVYAAHLRDRPLNRSNF
ncbi:hypothetical protein [Leptolyngbya sp. NIES-2104]|uniref:hypothetical protein n=1 Tax=Leptolyngbya sp. NIES-2104 TaxID=1552121 RepID=UPI0006EC94F0|nr:hypothetical protein [Leptolyngbya sp. NIES-2104]GAP94591.1 hypothetical protein NIES2104_11020 [Leptolyngbya sp. NIES-2104]